MDITEAREWLKGNRSMTNMIPQDPLETWIVRIAQADAAAMQEAYWIVRGDAILADDPASTPQVPRKTDDERRFKTVVGMVAESMPDNPQFVANVAQKIADASDFYDDGTPGERPDDEWARETDVVDEPNLIDMTYQEMARALKTEEGRGVQDILYFWLGADAELRDTVRAWPMMQPDHTRTTNPDGTRTPQDDSTHCTWTEDPDGIWHGTCGVVWECTNDTPAANGMQYCPQCGKPLVHAGATPSVPNTATKTTEPLGKPTPDELVEALRYVDGAPHTIITAAGCTTDEARTLAVAVRELAWVVLGPGTGYELDESGQIPDKKAHRRYWDAFRDAHAVQDMQCQ